MTWGKLGVPDAILLKPERLAAREFGIVKEHAPRGAEMVSRVFSDDQMAWGRHHHERWGGRGHPAGLEGEDIPDGARGFWL